MTPKYVLYIDVDSESGFHLENEYRALAAKTPFEAVAEAEQIYRKLRNCVYLVRIMEKSGKVETMYSTGWKRQKYTAKLCKRSEKGGWRENNELNFENHHEVYMYTNSAGIFVCYKRGR